MRQALFKGVRLWVIIALCGCVYGSALALPTPVNVQGYIGTKVHFSWGESTGEVEGYRIYWGTVEGGPYPHRLCDVDAMTHDHISSLDREQQHYLVCRAYNIHGESGNSNVVVWPIP